jgi:endonuclease YncB( thermonuclease family)
MPNGLLTITGSIDLGQFWPHAGSDADTEKVTLAPPGASVPASFNAFRYNGKVTHAFDQARVIGRISQPVINNKNEITIRLQGIDAPELPYTPTSELAPAARTPPQTCPSGKRA